MQIRRARQGESALLTEIAMCSKAYWGYEKCFIEACREALTISEECISSNHVYVLEDESLVIGFFCLIAKGQKGELDFLFIDPKYIGKGYGKILWDGLLQKAKEIGIKEFTIDADPHAEGFYKKMGAARVGEVESTVFKGRKLPLMKVTI